MLCCAEGADVAVIGATLPRPQAPRLRRTVRGLGRGPCCARAVLLLRGGVNGVCGLKTVRPDCLERGDQTSKSICVGSTGAPRQLRPAQRDEIARSKTGGSTPRLSVVWAGGGYSP